MMLQKEAAADEPAAASRSFRDEPTTADAADITKAAAESSGTLSETVEAVSSAATPETPISDSLLTRSKTARGSTQGKKTALKPGDPPKPKSRLTFDEAPKPKGHAITGKIVKPVTAAARAEIRHKLDAEADDNAALEASEAAGQTGESALRFTEGVHQRHELRQYRRVEKAEHKLDQANIHYLQKKDELERAANGKFRLGWNTRYSQGYMPQFTDRLSPPAWSNLVPHTLYEYQSHPYGSMSVIDMNTNSPMRFYRIKLEK